jgi:hypothetical protein
MRRRSDRVSRDGFDDARRAFESWRSHGARGRRIPDGLWRAAVRLAREHGVSRTALTLGLDYYSLKEHVAAGANESAGGGARSGGFVEMPPLGLPPAPGCILELEHRRGARLRIQLQGPARAEILEPLVRALWRGTRCSR